MADTKITALTALTAADPANDVIPIVDVSDTTMAASGTTKKISVNNILGASGTATLASATITGAATVGTTLGVTGVSTLTGAVGVGATPIGKFDVYNTVSDTTVFIRSDTTKLGQIVFRDNADSANQGLVRYDHLNDRLSFTANGAENLYLFSNGDVRVQTGNVVMATSGKGIDFSATAGTGTSELLNDYEEGTFTPTVFGVTSAGTGTYSSQVGRYTKVGNLVTVQVYLNWSAHTGTGNMRFGGLPFSASSDAGSNSAVAVGFVNNISLTAGNVLTAFTSVSNSFIDVFQTPTGGGTSNTVPIDTSAEIIYTVSYRV
jgi:hypothetical protein